MIFEGLSLCKPVRSCELWLAALATPQPLMNHYDMRYCKLGQIFCQWLQFGHLAAGDAQGRQPWRGFNLPVFLQLWAGRTWHDWGLLKFGVKHVTRGIEGLPCRVEGARARQSQEAVRDTRGSSTLGRPSWCKTENSALCPCLAQMAYCSWPFRWSCSTTCQAVGVCIWSGKVSSSWEPRVNKSA